MVWPVSGPPRTTRVGVAIVPIAWTRATGPIRVVSVVQAIHAVVEDGADALAVERRGVAGVLAPGGRARVGMVGDGQGGPAVAPGGDELHEPAGPVRDGHAGSAQEPDPPSVAARAISRSASATLAASGFSEYRCSPASRMACVDRPVLGCRRQVHDGVGHAVAQHRVELEVGLRVRRPRRRPPRPPARRRPGEGRRTP